MADNKRVQVKIGKETYKTEVVFQNHSIKADEPKEMGGTDLGPSPGELFLSSAGTCAAITIRMYANRKEWDLESVQVDMELLAKEDEDGRYTLMRECIILNGTLDEKQRARLIQIAGRCPVAKMIKGRVLIESEEIVKS
jgi:putative redox protein